MPTKPNVILIVSDQHSPHISGCYGDPVIQTPNLDRLAASGTLFQHAYCSFPLCGPSRMSFLTGREPHDIEIYDNGNMLASDIPTFAHALGHGGYETVLCGRMHFTGYDQRHGFQKRIFPEMSGGNSMAMLKGTNNMQRLSLEQSGPGRNPFLLYDDQCMSAAANWIRERHANVGSAPRTMAPQAGVVRDADPRDKPFLLVAGMVGPHCPFVCPPELFHKYHDRVTLPPLPDQSTLHPFHQRYRARSRVEDVTPTEIRRTRAAYYGMVDFMDNLVGRVVSTVEDLGLRDNTIIIYMSDHGEAAGEHGLWWKTSFYEGAAGVPMIFSWPGHIPAGQRSATLASLLDLAPTLTALTDSPSLPGVPGRGLADAVMNPAVTIDRSIFSQIISTGRLKGMGPGESIARMVRRGDWKFNYYHHEPIELFNLAEDPGELVNRATDPACKEIVVQLTNEALATWNPNHIWERQKQLRELVNFVRKAPDDPTVSDREHWDGPPNWGYVDPTCAIRES